MAPVITSDGSPTLFSEQFGEHYHSTFGAAGESNHIFIRAGYLSSKTTATSVLEAGFGTGLNAWLTLQQADLHNRPTRYESVELYPIDRHTAEALSDDPTFRSLHTAAWEQPVEITPYFTLHKRRSNLLHTSFTTTFDVVYFDAFSPAVQPELWSPAVFAALYAAMNPGAILTTYCAKGEVRRTMQSVGFTVERLPGPVGKREILRAKKPNP